MSVDVIEHIEASNEALSGQRIIEETDSPVDGLSHATRQEPLLGKVLDGGKKKKTPESESISFEFKCNKRNFRITAPKHLKDNAMRACQIIAARLSGSQAEVQINVVQYICVSAGKNIFIDVSSPNIYDFHNLHRGLASELTPIFKEGIMAEFARKIDVFIVEFGKPKQSPSAKKRMTNF